MYKNLFLFFSFFLIIDVNGQNLELQDCYAFVDKDTVTIGNDLIERNWVWKNGCLTPLNLKNKSLSEINVTYFNHQHPDADLPDSSYLNLRIISETEILNSRLQIELIAEFHGYDKKTLISIFPEVPAIRIQHAFRKKNERDSALRLNEVLLDQIRLPSLHYTIETIEFFDRTDDHNNLVLSNSFLPFHQPTFKRANLLFANSNLNEYSFFMLKEAPCSFVQLNYPGYDFIIDNNKLISAGTGLSEDDLPLDIWVSTYASVTGVQVNNKPLNFSLRAYQKSIRKNLSYRDDMIMLNTWGDRNRDQSINEEFCMREIDACVKYGITHFQIDDGWQKGLSKNSANSDGRLWDNWEKEHWEPNPERFPGGFTRVVEYADENDIKLGLWFHPSNSNGYMNWRRDAEIVAGLYSEYGIKYFKIDGINLPDKRSDINFRKFLDYALELSQNNIVFNLDATADNRGGYHYFNEYGNIFLENRYTDWANYYPHWTLRNLWQLSAFVPPERIQIEFLNTWRNVQNYPETDILAPINIPFDYVFAIAMVAQPLAWLEASNLPQEAEEIIPLIKQYKEVWHDFHKGYIFPVGQEPDGTSWTGFQSINNKNGYFIIFREHSQYDEVLIETYFEKGKVVDFELLAGYGKNFEATIGDYREVTFWLPKKFSYSLYRYSLKE